MSGPDPGERERDVAIVGGGPAGCSAGVFTARYGLDTVVFDRGPSSLRRCAYLENYLGFPGGVDVDTFYGLIHDHAEAAGCEVVSEPVESVRRSGDGSRLVVETREGQHTAARRVVAATRYGGEYLRPLGGDELFVRREYDGEVREYVDPGYADADGRTPVDGLYVAAPAGERNAQAIVSAGHGAHVARSLLADLRSERGFPDGVSDHYDWLRPPAEFAGERGDRDHWRERFDERIDDAAASETRLEELRERHVDRLFETRRSAEEIAASTADGHDRLLEHVDDDRIRAYLERTDEPDGEAD